MERERCLGLHLGDSKCRFVAIIHIWRNSGRFNWHSAWRRYFPNHANECQWHVNDLWSCVLGCQVIAQINELISAQLTTIISKNAIYKRKHTDSKIIDIAICKTCKNRLLAAEYVILVRYYHQTAKASALYESTDGPAARPANNPPNSDLLEDWHRSVPALMVWVYWQPRLPIWQPSGFYPDPDLKWRSGTVANSTQGEAQRRRLRSDYIPIHHRNPYVRDDYRSPQYGTSHRRSRPVWSRPKEPAYGSSRACDWVHQRHEGLVAQFRRSTWRKYTRWRRWRCTQMLCQFRLCWMPTWL